MHASVVGIDLQLIVLHGVLLVNEVVSRGGWSL